ncbi:hypothetical protein DY000_02000285 [Brassica cretica]|uniref:DOG1 domain-containing protein n=1 Tax=Brassica cretica TaxID=69181 RepID=A0ABQ7BT47_BRACR|nr:hypothetical protein DY000_02000285 [Brassica cretica]
MRIIEYMQREAEAAVFDMEYTRWQEEQQRLLTELRMATQEHLAENELRMFVDNCLAHYDHLINLKAMVAKTDVFHLISGAWKSPAERCFLWMGGFRPSEIIKVNLVFACTKSIIFYICPVAVACDRVWRKVFGFDHTDVEIKHLFDEVVCACYSLAAYPSTSSTLSSVWPFLS